MMFDEPLPSDFEQFEQELAYALKTEPSAGLSRRIATTIHSELWRKRTAERWKFTLGIAATFLVWANLTFCACSLSGFHLPTKPGGPPVDQIAREIRNFAPELSCEEAYRQALAMSASTNTVSLLKGSSNM